MKLPQWWTTSESAPEVRYVAGWQRLLIGGLLVALGALLWAALIGTWPAVTNATADSGSTATDTAIPLAFGLWRADVSGDTALLVLVIEASLLGSLVHVATSFAAHSSRRNLTVSYLWWYPMRFIVGAGLALLLYTALRGGLFTGDFTSQEVNPYGIAAVAGITGMFSKQATAKLAQLFDVAFAIQPAKEAPKIDDLDPKRVTSGAGDTTIKVSGSGFVNGATATAGNTSIDVRYISDTELEIVVPSALLSGAGTIKVRVDNPDPTVGASAPADLTVE
jgi:IPT/TIG domain